MTSSLIELLVAAKNVGQRQGNLSSKFFSGPIKFLVKALGLNKILCLEKVLSKNILVHKNYDPQNIGSKNVVKIRPVTSDILLIWANVTNPYVSWTIVTITVGILYL